MNDDGKPVFTEDDGQTRVMDSSEGATTAIHADPLMGADFGSLALLDRLELPIEVRLGRLVWELEKVIGLRIGDAVPIGPDGDDTVTLCVQGRPYALGDLVVVDGRFAFRVRELVASQDGGGAG